MTKTAPPPEAVLIKKRRLSIQPRLSIRRAATLAEISEGRWRQIENGYQQVGAGTQVEAQARPETLARMAKVVGATPAELTQADRDDAAQALRALIKYTQPTELHAAHAQPISAADDHHDDNDEIYELEAARSIQHTVDAILGTTIPFTDEEITELHEIQSTAGQLPEIFGKLLGLRMGRRELMRNCITLQHRITNILRDHSNAPQAPTDTKTRQHD
ncbi:helix-turn-helix domain-containing protein [Mycobacteroides abscessus]|uniref:helix-turn-helix domain-containing protein n=1 Tax=Mycobacteroides abscessus TaxID=36809 RepID=UPI0012FF15DD|nr:helix-turn-helix transcriptional regulator [Mycobacteroides abscessus]